jgi:sterol desaturase/sphingolipid hydroxylase (fatty acid hydroxylase superfamily)
VADPRLWPIAIAAGLFLVLLAAEALWPQREANWRRWPVNLGLGAATLVIARLLGFIAPLGAAIWAERSGFGLFNWLSLPFVFSAILTVILLDLAVWWQHRQFHRRPWLWRWHKLHHADGALDLSTGVRFHPMEAIVSLAWKSACTALIGAPPLAVPLFELWLTGGSFIEHSNLRLPRNVDFVIRRIWVTPAMHAVHHSAHGDDANHNFGFAIALWDRLFKTYQPIASGPRIGLAPA